ncbi:MAG TPA: hypothetical protein VNT79_02060, partial [Phycisphaerae bacterium]|nr:hypothetical protein [Phycisphaerae bacterium]
MKKSNRFATAMARGAAVCVLAFGALGRIGSLAAQDTPTTQKAEETKETPTTKPAAAPKDEAALERARAAAIASKNAASTQPAAAGDVKPITKPVEIQQPTTDGAKQPDDPRTRPTTNRPSRTPGRIRPSISGRGRANQGDGVVQPPPDEKPPTAVNPPPVPGGRTPTPQGNLPQYDPRNPRGGNQPARPALPGVAGQVIQPGAAPASGEAATGEAANEPVVTNTTSKMLVFTIEDPQPESRTYRFLYVDMPWQDVLADFSRVSGLPLVNKPDPPIAGNLTYFSNDEYTFIEALHKLNELLQLNPLNNYVIQRTSKYLTVERIPDLVRKIPPERMFNTFAEFEAANLDPYEVCLTKYDVPTAWSAFQIIENFRSMFSDTYGTEILGPDTIQLTGLAKEHLLWKVTIDKLTRKPPITDIDQQPEMIYTLKVQKAATAQGIIMQLYGGASAVAPRARPGAAPTIDQSMMTAKQLNVVPDITNNVLYITGPQYMLDDIKKTLERIDVG